MLHKENIKLDNLCINNNINNNNLEFSFGKSNNIKEKSNNRINENISENKLDPNHKGLNDKNQRNKKAKNCNLIFNLLNRNKNISRENSISILNDLSNINQQNKETKPKIGIIENYTINYQKYNKNEEQSTNNNTINANIINPPSFFFKNTLNNNNYNIDLKIEDLIKTFNIKDVDNLPYEIKYFIDNPNPNFTYDFEHQNDINSNNEYITENFLDILLNSFRKKMIINSNIKPMKETQAEITFSKRNILVSWLTEINFKYIKEQNVLFTAIKYLDLMLYNGKAHININDFQLIGILCFNLALKMENHHKVLFIDEIMSLIGSGGDKLNDNEKNEIIKKIKYIENKICEILDFDLEVSTSVLILQRLIQILNIKNKNTEKIFHFIAYFFLELSLYDEQFYEFDDFVKALSSLLITKELLSRYFYKFGFHNYLATCSKIKKKEIKSYCILIGKVIKKLKEYKYGSTIFIKYQHKDFHNVINNYLNQFIINCIHDKNSSV